MTLNVTLNYQGKSTNAVLDVPDTDALAMICDYHSDCLSAQDSDKLEYVLWTAMSRLCDAVIG